MSAAKALVNGLIALLGLAILATLGAELFTLGAPILKNYNEGWNAYRIAAATTAPATLYPAKASLLTNNYPPLSFFLVGGLARLTGDAIIAGRIVAFLSTLGTGVCFALAARAAGCAWRHSLFAALLFWAAPWVIVRFSALNDPQMLGNFLDAVGLVVILSSPRETLHLALAALFLTAAEFVKPLFVTLPLALLIWLFVYDRRSAWWLLGFGVLFALIGLGLTALFLHINLLAYIFSPRAFLWSKLTGQPGQWLLVELLPFAASLALFRRPSLSPQGGSEGRARGQARPVEGRGRGGFAFFGAVYAALGFAFAVIFSGGDGVSASQMMEPAMAVAFGAARFLARAGEKGWIRVAIGFVAGLQALMLVLSFLGLWASRPSLPDLMGSRYATRYDIGVLAARKDPVLCETLALCYWAGRKPQVDVFGVTEEIAQGARSARDLTRLLDAHAFAMIQLQPGSRLFPPSPLWGAVLRNYYLEHQDKNGMFLIPRDQPLSGRMDIFRR